MTSPNFAVSLEASYSAAGYENPAVGDCVVWTEDGYVLATAAARGDSRTGGIVVQLGPPGTFLRQSHGDVYMSVTGLAPYGDVSYARVNAAGRLERVDIGAEAGGDDIFGTVDPSGILHACAGMITGGVGPQGPVGPPGPSGLPAGQGVLGVWQGVGGGSPALMRVPSPGLSAGKVALPFAKYNNAPAVESDVAGSVLLDYAGVPVGTSGGITAITAAGPDTDVTVDFATPGFRVEQIRGDAVNGNVQMRHAKYNRTPSLGGSTTGVMDLADRGRTGERGVVAFAAAAGAANISFPWRDASRAIVDVRAVFTVGTAVRRLHTTWSITRTTAGNPVVTLLETATPTGGAIATVAAALAVSGNNVVLILTPNAAATECSWSWDGDILRAV